MTLVAVPGMTPFVGPTGYVLPLSQIAETVRDAGVERTYEKFHANVMGCDGATLKKAMVVCGGWVMVMSPAGTDAGMLVDVEFAERLDEDAAVEDIRDGLRCERGNGGSGKRKNQSRGRERQQNGKGHITLGPSYPGGTVSRGGEQRPRPSL
jgi:hypothetical protein